GARVAVRPGEGFVAGGSRYPGSFSSNFTAVIPAMVEQTVAMIAVPMMAEGFFEPATASTATAVAGINWIELVLIARNVHIAFDATPGRGLSVAKSFIARMPSGVAALARPRMFAAMFMSIEPIAGCSAGTSGKS